MTTKLIETRLLHASVVDLSPAAQFAADDLTGRGQRQFVDEHDVAGRLVPGEALADKGANLTGKGRTWRHAWARHDKRADDLTAHRIGHADHGRHQHGFVLHQAILDVGWPDAVAAARDQIVLAALVPDVAGVILERDIAGEAPVAGEFRRRRLGVVP